ncbi:TPA: Arm DNA-binding domain-containing protein [Stenotrophomonas maltophilia]
MASHASGEDVVRWLGDVVPYEHTQKRPMLTSLVVHRSKDANLCERSFSVTEVTGTFVGAEHPLRSMSSLVDQVTLLHNHWSETFCAQLKWKSVKDDPHQNIPSHPVLSWRYRRLRTGCLMSTALTKRIVPTAEPRERHYELRDAQVRGLILRVQPSGHKAWVVTWAHGKRRTLGSIERLSLDQARDQARQAVAEYVQSGLPVLAKTKSTS